MISIEVDDWNRNELVLTSIEIDEEVQELNRQKKVNPLRIRNYRYI
jgi:hypothetical protein